MVNNLPELYSRKMVSVSIYYSVDELVDEDTLREELEATGLIVKFGENELKGIITIQFENLPDLNIDDFLYKLKSLVENPLKKALKKKDKREKIISALKETDYLNNFVKLAQSIARDIKEGRENIDNLKKDLEVHRTTLGETGIQMLINVYTNEDAKKIIDNYAAFQELLINKFAFELYASQQIDRCFLLILRANKDLIVGSKECYLNIEKMNHLNFVKVTWNINTFKNGKTVDVYVLKSNENVILFEKSDLSTKLTDYVIWLKLLFLNTNSGIMLMDYSLSEEEKIMLKEKIMLPYQVEEIRTALLNYDITQVRLLIDKLVMMLQTSTSYMKDLLLPIKLTFQELITKQIRNDKKLSDSYLTRYHKDEKGLVAGVTSFRPPARLNFQLPSILIKNILLKIRMREKFGKEYNETLRDLIKEAKDIEYQKSLRSKNIKLCDEKILTERINRFTDQLLKLSTIIKDWFDLIFLRK